MGKYHLVELLFFWSVKLWCNLLRISKHPNPSLILYCWSLLQKFSHFTIFDFWWKFHQISPFFFQFIAFLFRFTEWLWLDTMSDTYNSVSSLCLLILRSLLLNIKSKKFGDHFESSFPWIGLLKHICNNLIMRWLNLTIIVINNLLIVHES